MHRERAKTKLCLVNELPVHRPEMLMAIAPRVQDSEFRAGTATLSRIFYIQEPERSIQQSSPHFPHAHAELAPTFSRLSTHRYVGSPHVEGLGTRNTS